MPVKYWKIATLTSFIFNNFSTISTLTPIMSCFAVSTAFIVVLFIFCTMLLRNSKFCSTLLLVNCLLRCFHNLYFNLVNIFDPLIIGCSLAAFLKFF